MAFRVTKTSNLAPGARVLLSIDNVGRSYDVGPDGGVTRGDGAPFDASDEARFAVYQAWVEPLALPAPGETSAGVESPAIEPAAPEMAPISDAATADVTDDGTSPRAARRR